MLERGLTWYEWQELYSDKLLTPLSIAFAEVASHNHFVLDRGGKVFKQSAPVIKLPQGATEDDHLALLGLLNSSTACFWMKQVFHNKGATSDTGVLQADPEGFRFEFDGTKLQSFPIPALSSEARTALIAVVQALNAAAASLGPHLVEGFLDHAPEAEGVSRAAQADIARRRAIHLQMVRWQEELDWLTYEIFGLLAPSSRARSLTYFQLPDQMPSLDMDERSYRHLEDESPQIDSLGRARLSETATNPRIALIERPEYKRRWYRPAGAYSDVPLTDDMLQERAVRSWLLDRLESPAYWAEPSFNTCARLADRAQTDRQFMTISEVFKRRADFDVTALVTDLVTSQAVPFLPALRYKESGLRKRARWEETWALQRREDVGEKVGDIPVPPKYASTDFLSGTFWRLRGKLDVPKERFISCPGCERDADPSLVVGWAGWDHLQQAQALAAYYVAMKDVEGWDASRLTPLLAGLLELLPWLVQWHNEADATVGMSMAEYFQRFVDEETRSLGLTLGTIQAWRPEKSTGRKGRKRGGA
jgi:hypothetical protein